MTLLACGVACGVIIQPPSWKFIRYVWYTVLLYEFDNANNPTDDSSVVGTNVGTVSGATYVYATNTISGHYSFDGINDKIYPLDQYLMDSFDNMQMSAWVKPNGFVAYQGIVCSRGAASGYAYNGFFTGSGGDVVRFFVSAHDSYKEVSPGTLSNSVWQFICGRWERSSRLDAWLDRTHVTNESPFGSLNMGDYLYIGWDDFAANRYFSGSIDDVRVCSSIMTAVEVDDLFWEGTTNHGATVWQYNQRTNEVYTNALVVYYPWEYDAMHNVARWYIGSGALNGTESGLTAWSDGTNGAMDFDGVNDYCNFTSMSQLDNKTNMTISVWIKMSAQPEAFSYVADKRTDSYDHGWQLYSAVSNIQFLSDFNVTDIFVKTYSNTISIDTWCHVGVIVQHTNCNVYINGVEPSYFQFQQGAGTKLDDSDLSVIVGRKQFDENSYFDGLMDDFMIFRTNLTEGQLTNIYNDTKATYGL